MIERLIIRRNRRDVHRVPRQQELFKLLRVGQGGARHAYAGDRLTLRVQPLNGAHQALRAVYRGLGIDNIDKERL